MYSRYLYNNDAGGTETKIKRMHLSERITDASSSSKSATIAIQVIRLD